MFLQVAVSSRLRKAAAAGFVLFLVPPLVGCGMRRESPREPTCAQPRAVGDGAPAQASAARSGRGLMVAEQGFTQVPGTGMPNEQFISVGAVIDNLSAMVAYRTRIRVHLIGDPCATDRPAQLTALRR
ncbi:MAG TPA: hypothetical protein VH561_23080 [Micromonosporaceae bacterium]|jgi:hypothetical protein